MRLYNKVFITIGIVFFSFGIIISFTSITGYFIFPSIAKQANSIYGSGITIFGLGLMLVGFRRKKEKPYNFANEAVSLLGILDNLKVEERILQEKGEMSKDVDKKTYEKQAKGELEKARERYKALKKTSSSSSEDEKVFEAELNIKYLEGKLTNLSEDYTKSRADFASRKEEWKVKLQKFADKVYEFSRKYKPSKLTDGTTVSYATKVHEYLEEFLKTSYVSGTLKELPKGVEKKLYSALANLEKKARLDIAKRIP